MDSKEALKAMLYENKKVIDNNGYIYSIKDNIICRKYLCEYFYLKIDVFIVLQEEFSIYEEKPLNKENLIKNLILLKKWSGAGSLKEECLNLLAKYLEDTDISKEIESIIAASTDRDYCHD